MALGENELSQTLKGSEALLLTERSLEDVKEVLSRYKSLEFARTGSTCKQTVKVVAQALSVFNSDLKPTLHDLGMPVDIKNGVIMLMQDYEICQRGQQLTNTMCRLLVCRLIGGARCRYR